MNIGYKKLQNNYIAKLEILGKTNENRKNIADPQYAIYRTSKVKVLKIFHMNSEVDDETQIIEQMDGLDGLCDKNFVYIEGKEMHVSNYDEDVNEVCSQGIHYFKTPFQAKMWELNVNNYIGKYMEWYDNGTTQCEGEYKNGKKEGKWTKWHENGTTRYEGKYKDGKEEGKWIWWRENSSKLREAEYKNGKEEGKWIWWYWTGRKEEEGEYKDGKKEGKWIGWYDNDNKESEGEYKDGEREGKWIWWWENGNKREEIEYKDGKEKGKWFTIEK